MLSIFSCDFWPPVYFPWRNVYLDLLPIFWLGCLYIYIYIYIYWAAWAVCIFWRLIPCRLSYLQIFSNLKCRLANLEARSQPGFVPDTGAAWVCAWRNASVITVVWSWVGGKAGAFIGQREYWTQARRCLRSGVSVGTGYAASASIFLSNHTKQHPKPCHNPFSWLYFLSP